MLPPLSPPIRTSSGPENPPQLFEILEIQELLENAVDAKARTIQLIIKNAGKTLVQVIDDGEGMSNADLRLAFERHATSKINLAEDLFGLTTKGFRGEALASIASFL